tara:strand:- start:117 stop:485 length:369 start_codon:yes stop_codon:yes gene_type:complete
MLKPIVAAAILITCNVSTASDLNGFWQHPKDPVWLDVNEAMGTGIAVRNDDDPSSVGFAVLKEVVEGPKQGQWSGQVYVPQLGAYKQVTVTLPDATTLKMKVKIGFISRSVEWTKVASVPPH